MCARPHSDKSSCCVCVDYIRNMASVFSGSVLLSLDVCGRAPETSSPSSVRLMPLASLCVRVNIGSQVSSIPAGSSGGRGNDNIQSIGNRVKSHLCKWIKSDDCTVCVSEHCGVKSCWDVTLLCSHQMNLHRVEGLKSSAASWWLDSCSGFFGLLDSPLWSFPSHNSTGWPRGSMLGQKRDCPLTLQAFLVEWLMHFKVDPAGMDAITHLRGLRVSLTIPLSHVFHSKQHRYDSRGSAILNSNQRAQSPVANSLLAGCCFCWDFVHFAVLVQTYPWHSSCSFVCLC